MSATARGTYSGWPSFQGHNCMIGGLSLKVPFAGNYHFLPRNAAIIDISPHTEHHKWAVGFVSDFQNLNLTLVDMPLQHSPLAGLAPHNSNNTTKRESYDRFWQEPLLPDWQRWVHHDCLPDLASTGTPVNVQNLSRGLLGIS